MLFRRMRTARSNSRQGGLHQALDQAPPDQAPPDQAPQDQASPWDRHPPGTPRANTPLEQTPPGSRHPPGPGTPPVNRMTNRCKNITFPQISFAGVKTLVRATCRFQ